MNPLLTNPFIVAAAVIGVLISLPVITLVIRATTYVVNSDHKLDAAIACSTETAASLEEFIAESRLWREERAERDAAIELTLYLITDDLGELQDNHGIARREWPERRVSGVPDRRKQA